MNKEAMQQELPSKREVGFKAEDLAAEYLQKQKFKIIERNFNTPVGEVDLIARKDKNLYFIEVRARGKSSLATPWESITYEKKRRIKRTAQWYLNKNPLLEKLACFLGAIAIDLSAVPPRVECLLDAFE